MRELERQELVIAEIDPLAVPCWHAVRMSVQFRYIFVHCEFDRNRKTGESQHPGLVAFARAAVSISDGLAVLLRDADIRMRRSALKIMALQPSAGNEVELTIVADLLQAELARVAVPDLVAELSAEQRRGLAAKVIIEACKHFDLESTDLDATLGSLAETGISTPVASPWKSSPDRKHKARVVEDIDVDGVHHVWFEVTQRGMQTPTLRSDSLAGAYVRMLRAYETLTWDGESITVLGHLDTGERSLRQIEISDELGELEPTSAPAENVRLDLTGLPPIRIQIESDEDPTKPAEVHIGTAVNGWPKAVDKTFRQAWRRLAAEHQPELDIWWRSSGWATLTIHLCAEFREEGSLVSSMKYGRDLYVFTTVTQDQSRADPEAAALATLQRAVDRAGRRAKLKPPIL